MLGKLSTDLWDKPSPNLLKFLILRGRLKLVMYLLIHMVKKKTSQNVIMQSTKNIYFGESSLYNYFIKIYISPLSDKHIDTCHILVLKRLTWTPT